MPVINCAVALVGLFECRGPTDEYFYLTASKSYWVVVNFYHSGLGRLCPEVPGRLRAGLQTRSLRHQHAYPVVTAGHVGRAPHINHFGHDASSGPAAEDVRLAGAGE